MQNNPFISIIIPVYKVEKYLKQCVDSIIFQNIENSEIILVDDGSPDNSPKICDEYAKKFDFIRVIHKENGGLSSARNTGILEANGDYLIFLDSDDAWNKKLKINEIIKDNLVDKKTEMYLYSSLDYFENEGVFKRNEHYNLQHISTDSTYNYYRDLMLNTNLEVSACTKIIKKSFIIDNDLFFEKGITSEDSEWMLRVLRKLQYVKVIPYPFYICRCGRADSITHSISYRNIRDLLYIIKKSISFYKDNPDNIYKNLEFSYCAYLWFTALGLSGQLEKQDVKKCKQDFKDTAFVCEYSNNKKTKLANFVFKLFGLNITRFILKKYLKYRGKHTLNRVKVGETCEFL